MRYVTLHFRDRRGTASLRYRNRAEITVHMSEHKSDMVWFSCRRKAIRYSVNMALGILQCEEEQRCSLQKSDKTLYYVACKTGVIGGALVGFAVGTRAEINSSFFSLFSFHMSRALRLRPQISEQTTISVSIVSVF